MMPKITIALGAALILVAIGFYVGTGMNSWTALIPAIPGALFALFGLLGLANDRLRMHVMHAAAVLAMLGTLSGLGMALRPISMWMAGNEEVNPVPAFEQATMGALCLVYLVFAVRSFMTARRRDTAGHAIP